MSRIAGKNNQCGTPAYEREMARNKVRCEYLRSFSMHHRRFLAALISEYKRKKLLPINQWTMLPAYYTDVSDKEIACFACPLIGHGDPMANVQAFREMFGESPWRWFAERRFVDLSIGDMQDKKTGGRANWVIAGMFDALWQACDDDFGRVERLQTLIDFNARMAGDTHFDSLKVFLGGHFDDDTLYMLFLILSHAARIGQCVWDIDPSELRCPVTAPLWSFLKLWFPDARCGERRWDGIKILCDDEIDFLWAYWAWERLYERRPDACRSYVRMYRIWYANDSDARPHDWERIFPPIDL